MSDSKGGEKQRKQRRVKLTATLVNLDVLLVIFRFDTDARKKLSICNKCHEHTILKQNVE